MKRSILVGLLVLLMGGVVGFMGCSDDNSDTPLEPGDLNATEFTMFTDQFDGVNEVTGGMITLGFEFIDSIMNPPPGAPAALSADETYSLTWVLSINAWVCTFSDFDIYDSTATEVVDTVKFYHGATPVQWPQDDSVTQITHNFWLTRTNTGSGTDGGTANMFSTLTRQGISDTVVLNVQGNISGQFEHTDIDGIDTTSCTGTMNFSYTASNITFDTRYLFGDEGELNCPLVGSITYTGAVDITCTGTNAGSVSGSWIVAETFDDGLISIVINNGTNSWTMTDSCPTGSATVSPQTDSIFLADLFDGPDMVLQTFQALEVTGMLLDSIPGSTGKVRPLGSLGVDDEIVITAISSYSYSNGWHIFEFEAISYDDIYFDTTEIAGIDSIQIRDAGVPVQTMTGLENIDEIWERAHVGWSHSTGYQWGDIHHRVDVAIQATNPDTILVLSGTTYDTLGFSNESTSELGFCEALITNNQSVTDLTMQLNTGNDCPLDGEVVSTTTIDASCVAEGAGGDEYFDINGTWVVTASVNPGGTITITYDGPVLDWTQTVSCDGGAGVSGAPWHW